MTSPLSPFRQVTTRILNQLRIDQTDEAVAVFAWMTVLRLAVLFGATLRFSLHTADYSETGWLYTAHTILVPLVLAYIFFTMIHARARVSVPMRRAQIYSDAVWMSLFYLLTLDMRSDLFFILVIPIALASPIGRRRERWFPLTASTIVLAVLTLIALDKIGWNNLLTSKMLVAKLVSNDYLPRQLFLIVIYYAFRLAVQYRERLLKFSPRVEKMTAIYATLTPAMGLPDLCQAIVSANVKLLGASYGHIRLLDRRTSELVWMAGSGPYEFLAPRRKRIGRDVSGKVALELRPQLLENVPGEPHFEMMRRSLNEFRLMHETRKKAFGRINSVCMTPLLDGNQYYGIAALQASQNELDKKTRNAFRDTMNNAIREFPSCESLKSMRITDLVQFAFDVERDCALYLHRSFDIFDAIAGQIKFTSPVTHEMVSIVSDGLIQRFARDHSRKSMGSDTFSQVIRSGQPQLVSNLSLDPHFRKLRDNYSKGVVDESVELEQLFRTAKAEVVVPLLIDGESIGCASLISDRPDYFTAETEKNQDDFSNIANLVSARIAEFSKREGVPIVQVVQFIADYRKVFGDLLQGFLEQYPLIDARGHVRLFDIAKNKLVLVTPSRLNALPEDDIETPQEHFLYKDLRLHPRPRYFRRSLQPNIFRDCKSAYAQRDKSLRSYARYLKSVRTEIIFPIQMEGSLLGTATLQSESEDFIRPENAGLFASSMAHAASMIESAYFRQQMEQWNRDLQNLAVPDQLDTLLQSLACKANELLHSDIVAILPYLEGSRKFTRPFIYDGLLIRPEYANTAVEEGSIPEIMASFRREFVCSDVADIENALGVRSIDSQKVQVGFLCRERIASSAGLLLMAGNQLVGVMFVNFRKSQRFSESRKQLMHRLSGQAALAIRNARLIRENLESGRKLSELNRLSVELQETPGKTKKVKLVLDMLTDPIGLHFSRAIVFLDTKLGDQLTAYSQHANEQPRAAYAETPQLMPALASNRLRIPLTPASSSQFVVRVMDAKQAQSGSHKNLQTTDVLHATGASKFFVAPLVYANKAIGALYVDKQGSDEAIRDADDLLVVTCARHAAISIQSERLDIAFQKIGAAIHDEKMLPRRIMDETIKTIIHLTEADAVSVSIYRRKRVFLAIGQIASGPIRFAEGLGDDFVSEVQTRTPGISTMVSNTRSSVEVTSPEHHLGLNPLALTRGMKAAIGLPMLVQDELIGSLIVYYKEKRNFGVSEKRLLTLFANQVTLTIENKFLERSNLEAERYAAFQSTSYMMVHRLGNVLPALTAQQDEFATKSTSLSPDSD